MLWEVHHLFRKQWYQIRKYIGLNTLNNINKKMKYIIVCSFLPLIFLFKYLATTFEPLGTIFELLGDIIMYLVIIMFIFVLILFILLIPLAYIGAKNADEYNRELNKKIEEAKEKKEKGETDGFEYEYLIGLRSDIKVD